LSFKSLTFLGGGRWASIVLKELLKIAPNLFVDWVCQSKLEDKRNVLKGSELFQNVCLVDKKNYQNHGNKKIIIASHSSQHCLDLFEYADVNTEILIEKPLFSSVEDFNSIIKSGYKNIFINLEFYYAFYIRDFYKEIESTAFKKLEFIWHDPPYEERVMEETKYSELHSSIFLDQLLHVVSICMVLNLTAENFNNITIDKESLVNSDSVKIDFMSDDTHISISISRFASIRKRKIILNDGETELNFSDKPVIYKNKVFERELSSSDRLFPVAETLKNFLEFPHSKDILDISIESLMPFLKFCFKCEEQFIQSLTQEISLLSSDINKDEKFRPFFAYHAGIMYYQELLESNSSCDIHFIRDDKSYIRLNDWWLKFIGSSNFKNKTNKQK
tara:strand:- start:3807 stop:4973 length:1167 start_codon:yes stop_codon:yes gene_type:complete